jgi:hypothetical protein
LILTPGGLPTGLSAFAHQPPPTPTPNIGFTYQRADGNRVAHGTGSGLAFTAIDVPLRATPQWLVAIPSGEGSLWVVTTQRGQVRGFRVLGRRVREVPVSPAVLPETMPPMLAGYSQGVARLANLVTPDTANRTHPALLDTARRRLAYLRVQGELVINRGGAPTRLAIRALPDARILSDGRGRLLLLTDPTNRYGHDVLGDEIEAGSITLVQTRPKLRVLRTIPIPAPAVIEGIAPIWADLDGDGVREIIVTLSDPQAGARIVAFDESGQQVAAGPSIGTGFRWRHQLAVAPFGPHGELELAAVRTPHIGGVVEFYRMEGDRLNIVATKYGFSSHTIGSANLDTAVAADWDGDGHIELLVRNTLFNELVAGRRTQSGITTPWRLLTGATVRTNLAAVRLANGRLVLGAGTANNTLRLWVP